MFFRITSHKTWINLNHVERITIDDGRLNNGGTEESGWLCRSIRG